MKKRITNFLLIIILLTSLLTVTGCGNNKTDSSNNESNVSNNESKETSEGFKFIYDINKISDEWWNAVNTDRSVGDIKLTNKEVYESVAKYTIGNTTGKLNTHPVGFTENITIAYETYGRAKEHYTLTVNDNNFLIPKKLYVINNSDSTLEFYVLGNDVYLYEVSLSIEKNPSDIELTEGSWKTEYREKDSYAAISSFYPINSDYCLEISYPSKSPASSIKAEDLKQLADKVTSLISLKNVQDTTNESYNTLKVMHDDVKLDDNTIVNMKNMKIANWRSIVKGVDDNKDTVILAYNSNNKAVEITEYNKNSSKDSIFSSFSTLGLKEYTYKNRDIYIVYGTDKSIYKGKNIGILFEIDGIVYNVSYLFETTDSTETNLDSWIESMCDGIITFK